MSAGTEPPPPNDTNVFLPEEGYFQIPEGVKADLVVVDVTPDGTEILREGKSRRVLIDVMPLTGRSTSAVFDVADTFESNIQ